MCVSDVARAAAPRPKLACPEVAAELALVQSLASLTQLVIDSFKTSCEADKALLIDAAKLQSRERQAVIVRLEYKRGVQAVRSLLLHYGAGLEQMLLKCAH